MSRASTLRIAVSLAAGITLVMSAGGQSWEPAPSLPTSGQPRTYAAGVNYHGTLLALGGPPWVNGGNMDGSVHSLPAGATSWTVAPPLGGMGPIIHQGGGVDALDRIIVFGGTNIDNGDPGEGVVYDLIEGPSTSIANRSPQAPAAYFAWVTDDQGRVYSIGGGPGPDASASNPNSTRVERYLASSNTWQAVAPLPEARADAAAAYDGEGHILVVGGFDATASTRTATVYQYDITANTWSATAVPPVPVALAGARAVRGSNDRIYVIGGQTGPVSGGTTQATVYKLDLNNSNAWFTGPTMTTPRAYFGVALGPDDHIYVLGGINDTGGTYLCERLYTPPCPVFSQQPQSIAAWRSQPTAFTAAVTGGTPLSYQWRRNGVNLTDGPAPGGGTISGATTLTLLLSAPTEPDVGTYDLVVTNACGSTISSPAALSIRLPPAIPTTWTVTNLHPAWAPGPSYAYAVSGQRQGGSAFMPAGGYSSISQPVLWTGTAESALNLTPSNSVGGAIYALAGDAQVGWWWWPYQCYYGGHWYTCYSQQAAAWAGTPASHLNLQVSGWEYSYAAATDGTIHAGSISTDDEVGNYYTRGGVWSPPNYSFGSLHPSGVANSGVSALADGRQYGWIHTPYPGPVAHAARWTSTAASFVDLHPNGASSSAISGASDGQQVGSAEINGQNHAGLWADAVVTFRDLNPPGATTSGASDVCGGLQAGGCTASGVTHAGLWSGTASSFLDLHAFVPANFTASSARAMDLNAGGVISVAGYGYNSTTGRYEALLWRSQHRGDLNCDGVVNFDDINPFVIALSDPTGYPSQYPDCNILNGDCDQDGDVDFDDISPFVALLTGRG